MTRINLCKPSKLTYLHLLAEYRELPRVFNYVKSYGVSSDIPPFFILGTGHIKFFTNKLNFLLQRYVLLCRELINRNIKIKFTPEELYSEYKDLINSSEQIIWEPTYNDKFISECRLKEKTMLKPEIYGEI